MDDGGGRGGEAGKERCLRSLLFVLYSGYGGLYSIVRSP